MLELKNICKSFGEPGSPGHQEVLKGISLTVNKGESIAIVGPSGCGKSTLLNIIGSLDKSDSGELTVNGQEITKLDRQSLEKFRSSQVGFVFQQHHLFPQCTLRENVLIPTLGGNQTTDAGKRADSLIKSVGLWERRNDKPNTMSGGECQRTAFVRALINKPAILLADEPTGALDEENAFNLIDLMLKLRKENNTALVMVTHNMDLASRMDKVYLIKNGKLVLSKA